MENGKLFKMDESQVIFSSIIFSHLEVKGYYRYSDQFQIYPHSDPNIPKSDYQSYYPLILEYKRDKGDNDILTMGRGLFSIEDRLIVLLNTFTNNLFFKPEITTQLGCKITDMESSDAQLHWFLPILDSPHKFLTQFSNPAIDMIGSVKHENYYYNFPDLYSDTKREFIIPDSLSKIFDSYFIKRGHVVDFLNTATDYVSNSVELFKKHKTLSFISSYTAIEAMVNLEFENIKPVRCKECSQLKYSVSKKFTSYLLKYIGESDYNKKLFKDYYNKRSSIIHKGERLKTERYFNVKNEMEENQEYKLRAEILQLSRLAITNWLLQNLN